MQITDKFVNRSFRVKPSGKPANVQRSKSLERVKDLLESRFRPSKTQPNTFVEKTMFAISSAEEKKKIPFESARLRKLRARSAASKFLSFGASPNVAFGPKKAPKPEKTKTFMFMNEKKKGRKKKSNAGGWL